MKLTAQDKRQLRRYMCGRCDQGFDREGCARCEIRQRQAEILARLNGNGWLRRCGQCGRFLPADRWLAVTDPQTHYPTCRSCFEQWL